MVLSFDAFTTFQDEAIYGEIPASSFEKHIGGFILKTFPWIPPLPTRIPSSAQKEKYVIVQVVYSVMILWTSYSPFRQLTVLL